MSTDLTIAMLNEALIELNCPASLICGLTGISNGTLSNYRNGVTRLTGDHDFKIRTAVAALKKLVEAARPIPVDFRRVAELRPLIDSLESGRIAIIVVDSSGPQHE
jgi:hypothetical protein